MQESTPHTPAKTTTERRTDRLDRRRWVSLGGALVLLITAGTLLYLGLRTPGRPTLTR